MKPKLIEAISLSFVDVFAGAFAAIVILYALEPAVPAPAAAAPVAAVDTLSGNCPDSNTLLVEVHPVINNQIFPLLQNQADPSRQAYIEALQLENQRLYNRLEHQKEATQTAAAAPNLVLTHLPGRLNERPQRDSFIPPVVSLKDTAAFTLQKDGIFQDSLPNQGFAYGHTLAIHLEYDQRNPTVNFEVRRGHWFVGKRLKKRNGWTWANLSRKMGKSSQVVYADRPEEGAYELQVQVKTNQTPITFTGFIQWTSGDSSKPQYLPIGAVTVPAGPEFQTITLGTFSFAGNNLVYDRYEAHAITQTAE